jgi:hypothetical protein
MVLIEPAIFSIPDWILNKRFCFEVQNINEHCFSYSNSHQNQEAIWQENQKKNAWRQMLQAFFIPR